MKGQWGLFLVQREPSRCFRTCQTSRSRFILPSFPYELHYKVHLERSDFDRCNVVSRKWTFSGLSPSVALCCSCDILFKQVSNDYQFGTALIDWGFFSLICSNWSCLQLSSTTSCSLSHYHIPCLFCILPFLPHHVSSVGSSHPHHLLFFPLCFHLSLSSSPSCFQLPAKLLHQLWLSANFGAKSEGSTGIKDGRT